MRKVSVKLNIKYQFDIMGAGFMVMEYNEDEFKHNPFTTDCRFVRMDDEGLRPREGADFMFFKDTISRVKTLDRIFNWENLMVIYKDNKLELDLFIGGSYDDIDVPSPGDLLTLTTDINNYCGFDNY